jgi:hypothetical protein
MGSQSESRTSRDTKSTAIVSQEFSAIRIGLATYVQLRFLRSFTLYQGKDLGWRCFRKHRSLEVCIIVWRFGYGI